LHYAKLASYAMVAVAFTAGSLFALNGDGVILWKWPTCGVSAIGAIASIMCARSVAHGLMVATPSNTDMERH
jgi:hypothetical protein